MAEVQVSQGQYEDDIFFFGEVIPDPVGFRTRVKEWAIGNSNKLVLALGFLGLAFIRG